MRHTVVVSSARFGANYFVRACQCSVENMKFVGEIFRKGSDGRRYMAQLLSTDEISVASLAAKDPASLWARAKSKSHQGALIAKLYYYHQPEESSLWTELAGGEDHVIHMIRRNLFDAYVSREIAVKFDMWGSKGNGLDRDQIRGVVIPEEEVIKFIEDRSFEISRTRAMFLDHSHYHEVFFEDICLAPELAVSVVEAIFGKASLKEKIKISKDFRDGRVKNFSNASTILNYEDICYLDRYHID